MKTYNIPVFLFFGFCSTATVRHILKSRHHPPIYHLHCYYYLILRVLPLTCESDYSREGGVSGAGGAPLPGGFNILKTVTFFIWPQLE